MFGFGPSTREARRLAQARQELKARALEAIATLLPHDVQLPQEVRQRLADLAVERLQGALKRREVSTQEIKDALRGPVEWAGQTERQAQRERALASLETHPPDAQ